ncbi:hypothetical protein [Actinomadura parmotrematis]|uniref:Secreted protein n=1 Tax=Actinomadura parmotrematis TaxID=2864039 RepID=A0ABS7FM91_9ACTN|nr:hypothetical protein [Actinomadura parmotrematis]MBW8481489.1 hypothetical protein [Actinomadura parmotrematis]
MKIRRPAVLTATAAIALLPLSTLVAVPAEAAPQARAAAAADPTPTPTPSVDIQAIIQLVVSAFPANIQADLNKLLNGDFLTLLTTLVNDVLALTPEQLQDIAAKLQALLGQLPLGQQALLKTQLSNGVTKQEALTILLLPR